MGTKILVSATIFCVLFQDSLFSDYSVQTLKEHTAFISAVTCSPDGTMLASGSGDSQIRIWGKNKNNQWECIQKLTKHTFAGLCPI